MVTYLSPEVHGDLTGAPASTNSWGEHPHFTHNSLQPAANLCLLLAQKVTFCMLKNSCLVFSCCDHTQHLRISLSFFSQLMTAVQKGLCQWGWFLYIYPTDVSGALWIQCTSRAPTECEITQEYKSTYTPQQPPQLRPLSKEGQQQQVMKAPLVLFSSASAFCSAVLQQVLRS